MGRIDLIAIPARGGFGVKWLDFETLLLPNLNLPIFCHLSPTLVFLDRDRLLTMRGRTEGMPLVGPEVEGGRVGSDLCEGGERPFHQHQKAEQAIQNEYNENRLKGLKLTLLSQMAIEFGSQWKRTWKSGFSLSWWKRSLRMASDSALGTPTIRRVKPDRCRVRIGCDY